MLILRAFFPISESFLQMHKEHVETISGYGRSNGGVNVQAWASTGLNSDRNSANSRFQEWDAFGNACFYLMHQHLHLHSAWQPIS